MRIVIDLNLLIKKTAETVLLFSFFCVTCYNASMSKKPMISVIIPVYNNESYLSDTLDSLLAQTFRDYEAIIVNDGSDDGTDKIIKRYAAKDDRIISIEQEHQGVSAARNTGLDAAGGKYAAFLDGDDVLPEQAYEEMCEAAEKAGADLTVGVFERLDGIKIHVNERTMKLGKKKDIDPWDEDLAHSFEVWNKFFSMDIIRKYNVRFEDFRYLEDVIFTYTFLQHTSRITSIDKVIYRYCRRLAIFVPTSTQAVSGVKLRDAIKGYKRLEEITESWPEAFHNEMKYRLTNAILIRDYYRHIWKLNDETVEKLIEGIEYVLPTLDPEKKERVRSKCFDLNIEDGFRNKEQITEAPLFTIYVTEGVSAGCVNDLLTSLYGQSCPNFACVVDSALAFAVDDENDGMPNISFGLTREFPNSPYVLYADCDMMLDVNTLSETYKIMKEKDADMAVLSAVDIDGTIIGGCEGCMGNKLIRTDALRNAGFKFKWADAFSLTKKLKCIDVKDQAIVLR